MNRIDEVRDLARRMVEMESRGNGDQMNALERVARSVGMKPRSLRRLINGETGDPGAQAYWDIREGFLAQMQRKISALQEEVRSVQTSTPQSNVAGLHDELITLAEKVRQAKTKG